MEPRYQVIVDPQYHVLLRPATHGKRWQKAHKEALRRVNLLRALGGRDDWQLALCQVLHETTSERTYAEDVVRYKLELVRGSRSQPDITISPEAMSDGEWARLLSALGNDVTDYFCDLLQNNGRTDSLPPNEVVVWGLRSIHTGRWLPNRDVEGVESLQIFRTCGLAERHKLSNTVVWMLPTEWWRKVTDAARTGYPRNVILLEDVVEGRTVEKVFFVQDMVQVGVEALVQVLATS